MSPAGWMALAVSLVLLPGLFVVIDTVNGLRARGADEDLGTITPIEDFEVLVPIYGSIAYLENTAYLAQYGRRVVLCTTTGEQPEFVEGLERIAAEHGFRIFTGEVARAGGSGAAGAAGKRATSGTTRDRLVRDALHHVEAPYVVCIDADTTTNRPLSELVGAMAARDIDLASIRLVPSNCERPLARLQAHEYRLAMKLRLVVQWLVSGACHAARTEVLRDVMDHHSLFFQGNDVETGVLADALGYRVGHIPFEVPTTVPDRLGPWWRQRLAWSGGEFRLFVVNLRLARGHFLYWCYGAGIVILASPLRWVSVAHPGLALASILLLYLTTILYLHWEHRDRWLWLMPLYAGFNSLVLTPLGLIWYVRMAWVDRNAGIIRTGRGPGHLDRAA